MAEKPTPEQIAELEERLKKMSPEELKEFQKTQCIFCQIVDGKVQARKVYEDSKVVAVLDINPANPGHMLIVPKEHYMIMPQIPDDVTGHLFNVAKNLSQACLRALEAQGTNIIVANGAGAGQKAQHFMIHLIPRKEGDNLSFSLPQSPHSEKELEAVKETMEAYLSSKPKKEKPLKIVTHEKPVVEAKFDEIVQVEKKSKAPEINIDDIARIFK